jgi:hypothetical protein
MGYPVRTSGNLRSEWLVLLGDLDGQFLQLVVANPTSHMLHALMVSYSIPAPAYASALEAAKYLVRRLV